MLQHFLSIFGILMFAPFCLTAWCEPSLYLPSQVKLPGRFLHIKLLEQLFRLEFKHSLTSSHLLPLLKNPFLQTQLNVPISLIQSALSSQLCKFTSVHSFLSMHCNPSLTNPSRQEHRNEPTSLMHSALSLQLLRLAGPLHSSMSAHDVIPFPVKPPRQEQVKLPLVFTQLAFE